jgi:IS5 family transposase
MFFEGIRSERELMRVAADRLSVRWYLGYDLHEPLPFHSSLTRARERFGVGVFRAFFDAIVERCAEAGLVWGEELFFDATKVRADADVDSLHSRAIVENHLEGLFGQAGESEPSGAKKPAELPAPPDAALPTHGDRALREANADRERNWISRDGRQDRAYRSGSRRRTADRMVSTTDPDATPMPFGEKTRLGYRTHYVVDGGRARIILNALVTPFEVTENRPMLDLLFGTAFRHGLRPRRAVGDSTYGTLQNIKGAEEAGIQALVPVTDFTRRTKFFGKERFAYDPDEDAYTCPASETLRPQGSPNKEGSIRYRAPAKACADCSLRAGCTDNEQGRAVHRHPEEHYLEMARARRGTAAYAKAMSKRKVWAEPPFAEAKRWHGMERFRLRGLERVNAEALLVAAGQNVKRLLTFGSRGPRKLAQATALRPPVAVRFDSGASGGTVPGGLKDRRSPFCNSLRRYLACRIRIEEGWFRADRANAVGTDCVCVPAEVTVSSQSTGNGPRRPVPVELSIRPGNPIVDRVPETSRSIASSSSVSRARHDTFATRCAMRYSARGLRETVGQGSEEGKVNDAKTG